MKQKILIAAALLLAASMTASGCAKAENKNKSGKLKVVSTIFPAYDFARQITKNEADITLLVPPGVEKHSFEPTPKDVIKIQNCDVFICTGGQSDAWVEKILSSSDVSKIKIITLSSCVKTVEEKIIEGMQNDTDEKHDQEKEPEYDEHVWTSPKNAKQIVQKISDILCELDHRNAVMFKQNAGAYLAKLDALDADFRKAVNNGVRRTIVLGGRFPFRYFADEYKLRYFAAFPGCSDEMEASPATVKFLIDKINAEKIPVIFHAELSSKKMANAISEATGAKVRLLHAVHNISKADFESGLGYLDIMAKNIPALKEALE